MGCYRSNKRRLLSLASFLESSFLNSVQIFSDTANDFSIIAQHGGYFQLCETDVSKTRNENWNKQKSQTVTIM